MQQKTKTCAFAEIKAATVKKRAGCRERGKQKVVYVERKPQRQYYTEKPRPTMPNLFGATNPTDKNNDGIPDILGSRKKGNGGIPKFF